MEEENIHNTEEIPSNLLTLDPLVFNQGFQHIAEQIFEKMDEKSLRNCREVSKTLQNFIDIRNILWYKIAKKTMLQII